MTRDNAYRIAVENRARASVLGTYLHVDLVDTAQLRRGLDRIVDDLNEALVAFEHDDIADLYDDLYISMFDALALLTDAKRLVNGNLPRTAVLPAVKDYVQRALQALDCIVHPQPVA